MGHACLTDVRGLDLNDVIEGTFIAAVQDGYGSDASGLAPLLNDVNACLSVGFIETTQRFIHDQQLVCGTRE